jgi:hypothetical protein
VTITDKLPAGVTATGISGGVGGATLIYVQSTLNCSVASVSCTFEGSLMPYERLEILINVKVQANAGASLQNEVSATGGEALPLSVKRPLTVSGTPAPFGFDKASPRNNLPSGTGS